jgi:hypothetical protein
MKHSNMIEALGLVLLVIAVVCMVYALWVVRGPAAWFGGGALLLFLSLILIATANRAPE